MLIALLVLVGCSGGDPGSSSSEEDGRSPSTETGAPDADGGAPVATGDWEQLDDLPLPGRATAVTFWVDGELVVVGGDTFTCPDNADCFGPDEPPFADGAALDPATGSWREIPDAPVPFSYASVAVVGTDAYLLTSANAAVEGSAPALLRYSPAEDAWTELALPDDDPDWYQLVAAGDRLVAINGSEEAGRRADLVFEAESGTWAPLPGDPFPASFERGAVWSEPHLYLFAKDLAKVSGPQPAVLQVARLDLAAGTWEQLPDSDRIGSGPWLAEAGEITSPNLGSADGGEVDGWDRAYQNGGTLDLGTGTWTDLPVPPGPASTMDSRPPTSGIVGATGASWFRTEGFALDVTRDEWVDVAPVPDGQDDARPVVATAGRDMIAVAGYRWIDPRQSEAAMLTDVWIRRTPPSG
ncbi:MAG TPA: hypothetical protein VGO60_00320 [Iamia sp.]|nr:hypothetical protein [Iamia sp.]